MFRVQKMRVPQTLMITFGQNDSHYASESFAAFRSWGMRHFSEQKIGVDSWEWLLSLFAEEMHSNLAVKRDNNTNPFCTAQSSWNCGLIALFKIMDPELEHCCLGFNPAAQIEVSAESKSHQAEPGCGESHQMTPLSAIVSLSLPNARMPSKITRWGGRRLDRFGSVWRKKNKAGGSGFFMVYWGECGNGSFRGERVD